ncbi:hypothetical protein [Streptomyces sp. CB01580]|uniref:hypothetical protein n=1 Tax=Streptomyces sp. CB01580 TaxID=1703933 RepID=UPI00093DF7D9|nr:hypothetical protein [Streptomyces sp. CB01580]OKJ44982.1 hypothetical protein AMK22_01300 [Streptomyces sp. CB01580]
MAPRHEHPFLNSVLLGFSLAAFIAFAALRHSRHRPARQVRNPTLPEPGPEGWFSPDALEGFPMKRLQPFLTGPNAPGLNQLFTAWILATHGHSTSSICHQLGLPPDVVHTLIEAAHHPERHQAK